jgi:hypothetical protein
MTRADLLARIAPGLQDKQVRAGDQFQRIDRPGKRESMHFTSHKSLIGKRPNLPANSHYDPCRRLLAAIILQAVRDAHYPEQRTKPADQVNAREFLADHQVRPVIEWLGIPWVKVQNGDFRG